MVQFYVGSMLLEAARIVSCSTKYALICDYINGHGSTNTAKVGHAVAPSSPAQAYSLLMMFDNSGTVVGQIGVGALVQVGDAQGVDSFLSQATSFTSGSLALATMHALLLATALPWWLRYEERGRRDTEVHVERISLERG